MLRAMLRAMLLLREAREDSEEEKADCLCLKWAFHTVVELLHYRYLVCGLEVEVMVDREESEEATEQATGKSREARVERNYKTKCRLLWPHF